MLYCKPPLVSLFLILAGAGCDSAVSGAGDILWTADAGTEALVPTQPLVEDDRVFAAYGEQLSAFDAESGEVVWTAPVRLYAGSDAGSVLDGGDVVYLNYVDWVKAFRKEDGSVVWTASFDALTTVNRARMAQNATHLFLGRRGEVIRIDKATGEIDLRIDISSFTPEGVPHLAANVELSEDGRTLFVPTGYYVPEAPSTSGYVLAFDAVTGALRWSYAVPQRPIPLPDGGERPNDAGVYGLGVGDGFIVAPAGQVVYALKAATGALQWERFFERDGFDAAAEVADGTVYIGSVQERVYKLDLDTSETVWEQLASGSLTTPLVVEGGQVLFVSPFEGSLWVLNASNGEVVLRERPSGDALLAPAGVGERLVVSVSSTRVYALVRP